MAGLWSGLKKRVVLDIGASAVRVCEVRKTKTGYEIAKYVQHEYNSDPSFDEQQRREVRTQALQAALKEARIRKRKAIIAVPGQSVFTRCRALPPVPEYKVNQIVRYEIQQQIPFGLDQIAMDYQILGRTEQEGYDVMMAAIKVDVVEKHLEALKPVKCPVAAVDVAPLAGYNWLKHRQELGEQGDCVAVIDIGAGTTDIVIERGNQFRFTRPLNIGGNDITRALMDAFNMDFVSAERIKRERGFAPTGDPKRDGKGGEVIGQVLQRLSAEIVRSFSYFRSLPGGGQVNRVLLTGGGARLKNIVPYLRSQLDMDVRIAQVLGDIKIDAGAEMIREHPEQATVALGMALRCCDTVTIDINLIPPRIVEMARRKEQALYWALSVCALVLIFASVVPAAANENKQVQERIEELKQAIRAYDPEIVHRVRPENPVPAQSELRTQLDMRRRHLQALEDQVNALDNAREWQRFWLDEISLVNEARPLVGQMWFSSIETTAIQEGQDEAPQQQRPGRMGQTAAAGPGPRRSTGFVGLQLSGHGARAMAGPRPGTGAPRLGIGAREEDSFAPGPARRAPDGQAGPIQTVGDVSIPRSNGLVIHGFAESDELIKEYINELRVVSRQMPDNRYVSVEDVFFSEASVRRVPWGILYEAPTDGGAGGRSGELRPGDPALYSFTIEIKLRYTQDRPGGGA